jgi:dTDP-4-amino-4,6-dideoxygalactose transaminase
MKSKKFLIICDALGSKFNNQYVGTFGDLVSLSFTQLIILQRGVDLYLQIVKN